MRTTTKFLSAIVCIVMISAIFTPVLAAESPGYTVAIPCRFDGVGLQFYGSLASVENGGKHGLIDKSGNEVIDFVYDGLGPAYIPASNNIPAEYFIAVQNGKWGILDKFGTPLIPCEYDSISVTAEGFAILGKGKTLPPGPPAIEGLWGLTDLHTGKEILPVKYNGIMASDDSLVFTVVLNSKTGVIDRTGKFIVPLGTFDYIGVFNSGYAMVEKNNKRGFINETGKIVIPVTYDDFPNGFSNGIVIARNGNRVGVINTSGKTVVPLKYEDGTVFSTGVISMRLNFKTIIMNKNGTVIAPAGKYDSVYAAEGNLIYVERGGKVGAIDMTGKQIVPLIYTAVRETKNGLAIVAANGKCAVINQSGRVIVPLTKFGGIGIQDDGFIIAGDEKGYRWGLINSKGITVLKYEYSSIAYMGHGYFRVSGQNGDAIFNESGEMIVPFGDFDSIGFPVSENMVDVRKDGLTGYITLPEYTAPPDAWAKPEVDRAIAAGLVPDDMRKNYQDNITRAEFCRLAVNLIEVKTGMKIDLFMDSRGMAGRVSPPLSFTDTSDQYVLAASRLGIVTGVGNNKFDPTGKITRQDAAVMLQQTAKVLDFTEPNRTPQTFADSSKFSGYAVDAIAFVSAAADKESGNPVMGSTGNNKFSPQDNYTRQQAYITMLRLFNAMKD